MDHIRTLEYSAYVNSEPMFVSALVYSDLLENIDFLFQTANCTDLAVSNDFATSYLG